MLQRQLAKAAALAARAAWPSREAAPQHPLASGWQLLQPGVPGCLCPPQVTQTLRAATILPSRDENKCIQSSSGRILPIHGVSTPSQGILSAPKSP